MTRLFLISALVGVLITAAGTGFAQQQPAPVAGPQVSTCSEQAAYCKSGCPYGGSGGWSIETMRIQL
jgi:hypothetical protein